MSSEPPESQSDALENARVEYSATHDAYMHYDNFSWQVGSVLLAGVFVYWGFIVSSSPHLLALLIGNLLVCLLMSVWLLYAAHNRQIYLFKLHRIYELEDLLGMQQHRRFTDRLGVPRIYRLDRPTGHILDEAIYVIVSLGGLLPRLCQEKLDDWSFKHGLLFVVTVVVVISTIRRVHVVDARAKSLVTQLEEQRKSGSNAA